eukprot:CAMPEP_0171924952 /NCGR_PEP_ID=MMETSP0993-20121228/23483_1 /TAXON_ID=483369 /ORGANISM="non described non described, Strain CCMP2098" /LENGTH=183 /DNA_ID=CAMNT_0012563381 /DNA_START=42 /DNA_END=590 /DNA_ORIENTATION=-
MKGAVRLLDGEAAEKGSSPPWRLHEDYPEYRDEKGGVATGASVAGAGAAGNGAGNGGGVSKGRSKRSMTLTGDRRLGHKQSPSSPQATKGSVTHDDVHAPPFVPPSRFREELSSTTVNAGMGGNGQAYKTGVNPPWLDDSRDLRPCHPRKLKERHQEEEEEEEDQQTKPQQETQPQRGNGSSA